MGAMTIGRSHRKPINGAGPCASTGVASGGLLVRADIRALVDRPA